jgi:polyhydroxyalkanoate synthase subunit PhaE
LTCAAKQEKFFGGKEASMAEAFSKKTGAEPLLAAWIKWTMDFWETMAQMGPELARRDGPEEATGSGDSWFAALNLWQAFFSLLTEAGTVAAVFQGIKAPSEIVLKMAQAGWGAYSHLHQQWLEGLGEASLAPGASDFETLDKDIFKICNDIYETDFSRLLDLPHLRLTGLSPDLINQALKNFNQFQTAMAEFIYLLFLPVKKSLRAMAGVGGMGRSETPPEDFKEYYKAWLKILEGHYMTLFQSEEYIRTLSHALYALEDFTQAKDALLAEAMTALSLPSRRDLDALYREMYLLKKGVKKIAKKMDQTEPTQGDN